MTHAHLPSSPSRVFRRLLVGHGFQYSAETVSEIALPLLVISYFGADSLMVGGVLAAEQVAWIVVGLFAGVWVDRWDKRRTLALSVLLRSCALVSIPVAALFGTLTFAHVLIASSLVGLCVVFASTAAQSLVPEIVDRPGLVRANSRLEAVSTSVGLVGQAGTGWFVKMLSAPVVLIVDAALGVVASIVYLSLPKLASDDAHQTQARQSFARELLDGLKTTFASRPLVTVTVTGALSNLAVAAQSALLFVYLINELHQSEALVGLALAAASLGGLVGAALTARVSERLGSRWAWAWSLLLAPLVTALIPLAAGTFALLIVTAGCGLQALLLVVANVNARSARQSVCPPSLIGRVSGLYMFVTWGLIPVGLLAGGWAGVAFGERTALWIVCGAFVIPALMAFLGPLSRVDRFEDLPVESVPERTIDRS